MRAEPLPRLNAELLEVLPALLDEYPLVGGPFPVGAVRLEDVVRSVGHLRPVVDEADVVGALTGLEALDLVTINDPSHVERYARSIAQNRRSPAADVEERVVIAYHPHPTDPT